MKKHTVILIIQLVVILILIWGIGMYKYDLRLKNDEFIRRPPVQGDELPVPAFGYDEFDSAGNPLLREP